MVNTNFYHKVKNASYNTASIFRLSKVLFKMIYLFVKYKFRMKLSKFDIGAEIISIITKGMYPDPKDALREYIQNGIDAKANTVRLKVRQESIVIDDNGVGMNRKTLRSAVRVGVSDKNPSKDIGFMGIGIYSSFHLCDKMTIFTRGSEDIPNRLIMDFGDMKEILVNQKNNRLNEDFDSNELIDLQSLLEKCIELSEDGDLRSEDFPEKGTRIELSGIESEFYSALSDFDEVAKYLENVIPLHFDKKNFVHAETIEDEITRICKEKNQEFELINLSLQVNSRIENLYRPYKDIDFDKLSKPFKPEFIEIEDESEFYGVAWGCLNSKRAKINNKDIRGFILKKQGFSIGRRESMVKYFPRGNTFFDRYSGEIIIVNPKILPNASRNDIEYSPLRSSFLNLLTDVADQYDDKANRFQEFSKADEDLADLKMEFKIELANYNEYEEDIEALLQKVIKIKKISDRLSGRITRNGFSEESTPLARDLLIQINHFETTIKDRVKTLSEIKNQKASTKASNTTKTSHSKTEIAKEVNSLGIAEGNKSKDYETLNDLLEDLGFSFESNFKQMLDLIDEMFIQNLSKSKTEYFALLQTLKERFENE